MQYATDIELNVHTYALGVADIAAHEGLPPQCVAFVQFISQTNSSDRQDLYKSVSQCQSTL